LPACPPAPGARARPACGPRPSQPRCPACRAGILEPLIADDRRSSRRRWTRRPCEVPASSSVVTARSPSREAPAEPPASGSPAPLNYRSNTGPPPPQNRFAGAAITAQPRRFGRVRAGKAFVLHVQRRFSWRRADGGLCGRRLCRSMRATVPSTSRASCTHRPRCRQMELLDSDDHGEARHAVRLPRYTHPQPITSTIRGRGRPAPPGLEHLLHAFCPLERLRLRAAGAPSMWVPRLHAGDAGSRGASALTAPTHVRLSVR